VAHAEHDAWHARGRPGEVEVWGDPAQHVRVRLHLSESSEPDEFGDADEADEDVVVVLSAELVEARPLV
jgi:hypothetical protein